MARKNSSSAIPLTAAAVSVVVISGLVGYYVLGGAHQTPQAVNVPIVEQTPPPSTPRVVHPAGPRSKNADYSAPGAPDIAISEDKSPTIVNAVHSHDAEASQAGTSIPTPDTEVPKTNDASTPASTPDTASPNTSSNTNPPAGSSDPNSTGSDSIPPPPGDTSHSATSQSPPSATIKTPPPTPQKSSGSNDHDFEQINGSSSHTADAGSSASNGTLYRVQTGSFADERNARILAATLSTQGFTTNTRSVVEGGKTVYKVQVGAYRSRAAADKAVSDLQHGGYPAYISTGKS